MPPSKTAHSVPSLCFHVPISLAEIHLFVSLMAVSPGSREYGNNHIIPHSGGRVGLAGWFLFTVYSSVYGGLE